MLWRLPVFSCANLNHIIAHLSTTSTSSSTNNFLLGQTPLARFPLILRARGEAYGLLLESLWSGCGGIRTGLAARRAASRLSAAANRNDFAHCSRYRRTWKRMKGVCPMKIVVIKSPKLLAGILRGIFGMKNTSSV